MHKGRESHNHMAIKPILLPSVYDQFPPHSPPPLPPFQPISGWRFDFKRNRFPCISRHNKFGAFLASLSSSLPPLSNRLPALLFPRSLGANSYHSH